MRHCSQLKKGSAGSPVFHNSPIMMPYALDIAKFADRLLRTSEIPDYPTALNGLQIGNRAEIRKVVATVDFSARTVRAAKGARADLLLVHHGAFWEGVAPLTGPRFAVISELLENDIAVYASHLPLDCHPVLGNNVLLAQRLGLTPQSAFAKFESISIGVAGESSMRTDGLVKAATSFASEHGGRAHTTPYEQNRLVGAWGICTGAGANSDTLREATQRGIKTLVVGEGPHWTAVYAEENDLVVIYAGHYATETLGVQALAAAVAAEFALEWEFIAAPTGT